MKIIFVRHGHPNYEKDCLTDLGHIQADAVTKRLGEYDIQEVYSSSCGRAFETAYHIAESRKLEVHRCEFMRETKWGSIDGTPIYMKGHPWNIVDDLIAKGQNVPTYNFENSVQFSNNKLIEKINDVICGFDEWIAKLGFKREGLYYRVCRENKDTVTMVSHGGSSTAVFAHIFNIPYPILCTVLRLNLTSVSIISFEGEKGSLISPKIEILNDYRHIEDIKEEFLC